MSAFREGVGSVLPTQNCSEWVGILTNPVRVQIYLVGTLRRFEGGKY